MWRLSEGIRRRIMFGAYGWFCSGRDPYVCVLGHQKADRVWGSGSTTEKRDALGIAREHYARSEISGEESPAD